MADETDTDAVDDMMADRTYTYSGFAAFLESDVDYAERYDALAAYTLRADTEGFPRKTRELVTIALTAAGGYAEPCRNHIEDARRHGATEEEIRGTIQLTGLLAGATSIITAGEALDMAEFPED